ncbi:MAG: glycine--tRNA ligase subunit beta [Elusimicrobia bacterium RIFCSPLOWO2_01_FULL_54_10]|nr:MAG: glycine--tRNA ligase subunit beta [Elusimicrobia bacterium RIFCSPLOWO2_01_FULL_54_10]
MDKTQDALFEIGTEEIPSSYLPPALDFMKTRAEERLAQSHLPFKSVQALGTPRRLALLIWGVAAKSEAAVSEVLGPKMSAAKDNEGNWTPAAQGFARSQGVPLEKLETRESPKGPVICAVKKREGEKAEKILAELFTDLPAAIPFPKKMVWEPGQFRFARPIRNLVALLGSKPLRVVVAGVRAANKTFPLAHLSSKMISISSAQSYAGTLKNNCILTDPAARKELIRSSAQALAKKVKGALREDADLLEEVAWLSEHPVGILGGFSREFLDLPSEVLITCMKKHQKFFSIEDESGRLLPHFVGIRNGISEHQETVRGGYEKVLLARLHDAKFFFDEDMKRNLDYFVSKASKIIVHEKLGNIGDKLARCERIALELLKTFNDNLIDPEVVKRAICLSKFDLVTRVIYEYPELQGIMGGIYAGRFGESPRVAEAIREHYYPLNSQSPLPGKAESKIAALSEKIDGLCGSFWIGNLPSGNADPYGLRRQSGGILRILLESHWDVPLASVVRQALGAISNHHAPEDMTKAVCSFLTDRFQLIMQESGYELDEIYSITRNANDPDLLDLRLQSLRAKIDALHSVRKHPDFEAVAGAYKRAGNILRQARQKGLEVTREQFDASLLTDPAEKSLHVAVDDLIRKTQPMLEQRQYRAALQDWVRVRADLDLFFEKVMVMVPDEKVCRNRLSLLFILESRFRQMADFSLIQTGGLR